MAIEAPLLSYEIRRDSGENGLGFELPLSVGQLGQLHVVTTQQVIENMVDERGFEPPASSLRTM